MRSLTRLWGHVTGCLIQTSQIPMNELHSRSITHCGETDMHGQASDIIVTKRHFHPNYLTTITGTVARSTTSRATLPRNSMVRSDAPR